MGYEIARNWRLKQQRYSLVGSVCKERHFSFPPRVICPDCRAEIMINHNLHGGNIFTASSEEKSGEEVGSIFSLTRELSRSSI